MLHASLAFLWPDGMQNYALLGEGVSAPLSKAALPMLRPTADGYISISFIQDREFEALWRAIGREALLADERFATAGPRAGHARALQSELDPTLRSFSTNDLVAKLVAVTEVLKNAKAAIVENALQDHILMERHITITQVMIGDCGAWLLLLSPNFAGSLI